MQQLPVFNVLLPEVFFNGCPCQAGGRDRPLALHLVRVVLVAALAGGALPARAQSLRTLWSFSGGADGSLPLAALAQGTNGTFYGTTYSGGSNSLGTVFQISADGSFQSLYSFGASTNDAGQPLDGANPVGGLVLGTNGDFYGTTLYGGTNNMGTVFELSPTGTVTTFYRFGSVLTNVNPYYGLLLALDGANPSGGLSVGSDGNFYGLTTAGGTNGGGTAYRLTPDGSLTTLHHFPAATAPPYAAEGNRPSGALVEGNDGNFYGTTLYGGTNNVGTAFVVTPQGGFTTLCQFGNPYAGMYPESGLALGPDGNFYGTTFYGGTNCCNPGGGFPWGNVFRLSTNGDATVLYSFRGFTDGGAIDRGGPVAGLVLGRDGNFYGTTELGWLYGPPEQPGRFAAGTVFRVTPQGALTTLWDFCSASAGGACLDGQNPQASLLQAADGSFYGTTYAGGTYGLGTVFQLQPAAPSQGPGGGYLNCFFTLTTSNALFTAQGGTRTVAVQAHGTNCSWSATSNDPFIAILKGSNGVGSGVVTYAVRPNTNPAPRLGSLSIAGQTFTVFESAVPENDCAYSLSATNLNLPGAGGSRAVSVRTKGSGCNWTAGSDTSFIRVFKGASGSGKGPVSFRVMPNTTGAARVGMMTIAGQLFTVQQAAGTCSYTLSPKSASVTAHGGTFSLTVTPNYTNCLWTAVSDAPFIQITNGATRMGKGKVFYTVATNTSALARTGAIAIAGRTFTVTQAGTGCAFSLSPLSASFGAAGGTRTVAVTAGDPACAWTAVSRSSFITVTSGRSGTGSGMVGYTVASNRLAASRSGSISIAGRSFLVRQLGQTNVAGLCLSQITTAASPPQGGVTAGDGTYPCGSTQLLSASPNNGWNFAGWSDGIGTFLRTITVPTTAATYTALFTQQMARITVLASPPEGGTTTGTGVYPVNSQVQIWAEADNTDGWSFSRWSDDNPGNMDNPRMVPVPPEGATYTALFNPAPAPVIVVDPLSLTLSENQCVGASAVGSFTISNAGPAESTLNFQISADADWLGFSLWSDSLAGGQSDSIDVYAPDSIDYGTYTALVTVSDTTGVASPQTVAVILDVNEGCLAGTTWSGFWLGQNYCCTGGAYGPTVNVSGSWLLHIDSADPAGGAFSGTLTWGGMESLCSPVADPAGDYVEFQRQPLPVGATTAVAGTVSPQGDCGYLLTIGAVDDNTVYGPFMAINIDVSTGQVLKGSNFITHPQPPPDSASGCTGLTLGSLEGFGPVISCGGGTSANLKTTLDRPALRPR